MPAGKRKLRGKIQVMVKGSPTLGNVSENVSVSVVDAEVINYENFKTFDTFPLKYKNVNFTASSSTCANLTLVGVGSAYDFGDGYCAWNVSYVTGINELVNITSTGFSANYSRLINVTAGRVYFDVAEVFGVFVGEDRGNAGETHTLQVFIFSNDSFLSADVINSDINLVYDNNTSEIKPTLPRKNSLFFSGDVFSSNSNEEFVN